MSWALQSFALYLPGDVTPPPAPQVYVSLTGDLYDDVVHDPFLVPINTLAGDKSSDAFLNDLPFAAYYPILAATALLRKFDVPVEWTGGLLRRYDVPVEWTGGLLRKFDVPVEWSGVIVLVRKFDVPVEWLAGLLRKFDAPAEWSGRSGLSLPVIWDVLSKLGQPLPVLFDVLSGGLVVRLPVRFSVKERVNSLPVTFRVIPNLVPLFSADVQQPFSTVEETGV